MSYLHKLLVTLLMALFLTNCFVPPVKANTSLSVPPDKVVHKLVDDSSGLTFEINIPWDRLSMEPVSVDGKEYTNVSLADWAETSLSGAPELPFVIEQIGAPYGAEITLQVTPGKSHSHRLTAPVLPSATQITDVGIPPAGNAESNLPDPVILTIEDPAIYTGGTYPKDLALITNDGTLRQQRIAGIAVFPVQYNPKTMELTIYESILVKVSFVGIMSTLQAGGPTESDIYETILGQTLLNSATASQWRQSLDLPTLQSTTEPTAGSLPWTPPVPGWRINIQENGFYKLTYSDLQTAGLPVDSLDPVTFRLFNMGNEIAVHVEGEADHQFDASDYILFYGQSIDSKYTADNVYWLTYGDIAGLRMQSRDGTPAGAEIPSFYMAGSQMEENKLYFSRAPGDENLDRWFWDYIYPPSKPSWTRVFSLAAPYSGPAVVTLTMLGFLDNPVNPDHHVTVTLNGTQVGDVWWDGISWQVLEMSIPAGILKPGTNTLVASCPNDTGLGYDVVYIDKVNLEFPNTFIAEGDELAFEYATSGNWQYQIDGFTTNDVSVMDVTNPAEPVIITGVSTQASPTGYVSIFEDTVAAPINYLAAASSGVHAVQAIEPDAPSDLKSTANGADYILIAPQAFMEQTELLRAYRASQGLRAVSVDVQDVYDEFGYGIAGAQTIQDFLAYAYSSWATPAPSFVLLVGDGHYDPKDYLNIGRTSFIPPYLAPVDPWIVETAADNRFVTIAGADTLPDMMLGRLAVNSPAEASAFVNKIIAYEQNPVGAWQKQVMAVADNADSGGNFAALSDSLLSSYLPAAYAAQKIYYGVTYTTVADTRAAILAGINSGALIVNYIGHASVSQWAGEGLFKSTDVAGLTNGSKLPIFLPMTCYDGYFQYPYLSSSGTDSTAEVVTLADGKGAVASWSPSGLGVSTGHDSLDKGFFKALFVDRVATIGAATDAGKIALWSTGANLDLLDTYLLFGDPAMRIPVDPTAVELLSFAATGAKKSIVLTWDTASEIDNLGFNIYRATSVDGDRTKVNPELIPSNTYPGSIVGASYSYTDSGTGIKGGLKPKQTYYYWLEAVDIRGLTQIFGPVSAKATPK